MGFWNDALGVVSGGTLGNENMGFVDNIGRGIGDYVMGDTRAARSQQNAANQAQGFVGEGYNQALGGMQNLADAGQGDMDTYRANVQSGAYGTDPSQFQTEQYGKQTFGQNAPQFNQFQQGQSPAYQSFQQGQAQGYNPTQRGQDPSFQQFNRSADPTFQRADAGNFNFNYEQSPGYQFARDEGIKSIEGRASAQGRRFTGGTDKERVQYASGLAAQDYGNQFNRARGSFEADRGFGAGQSAQQNQFNLGNYQFGAGMDANQLAQQNQFNQGNYQFGTGTDINQNQFGAGMGQENFQFNQNMGFQDQQGANQYGQNAFQFNQNMANQNNAYAQNMANQNYWQGQGMNQQENQFAANYNQGANLQNYNMDSQQNQFQAGLEGGLADQGYGSNVNLANMYIGEGEALGNAALGVGNANANRAMATRNTVNSGLNTLANLGQAGASIYGASKK